MSKREKREKEKGCEVVCELRTMRQEDGEKLCRERRKDEKMEESRPIPCPKCRGSAMKVSSAPI